MSTQSIQHTIAVASGKGGVGKSTTAVNLALALTSTGKRVGVLDADIYGPNQPLMLGVKDKKPEITPEKKFVPLKAHGLWVMSMGFLVDDETPMVWRGPMVSMAVQQLYRDTLWPELDVLVIDLPPGTGDVQLTMAKKIPVSAALIVTTPQDVALLDARKAVEMFKKVNVPILGLVENMSTHVCRNCGHEEPIFGVEGGAELAKTLGIELLGQLPLDITIREAVGRGQPTVVASPDSPVTETYLSIANQVIAKLALQGGADRDKFGSIKIEFT